MPLLQRLQQGSPSQKTKNPRWNGGGFCTARFQPALTRCYLNSYEDTGNTARRSRSPLSVRMECCRPVSES
jgi:hypothetical protein